MHIYLSLQYMHSQVIMPEPLTYGKCSKISNIKKEGTPYFLSSPFKKSEVTNFAKGGNLIAPFAKLVTSLTECLVFSFSKLRFYCSNF